MEGNNFNSWLKKIRFSEQKNSIRQQRPYHALSYYSVVYALTKKSGEIFLTTEANGSYTAFAFTSQDHFQKTCSEHLDDYTLMEYTVGELSNSLEHESNITLIKINADSINANEINICDQIIISPIKDKLSGQRTITEGDKTLPLVALDRNKVQKMGFEAVYGFFRQEELRSDDSRTEDILQMIDFIEFTAKRTPIKFGSSSIVCLFLDFENPIEENQFIREYQLMDSFSNVLFVNSNLELINSYKQRIQYDGDQMQTILMPIIEWQRSNNPIRQEFI